MVDILLIEDQKDLAELLCLFLQKADYSVHHVVSGEEGIEYMQQKEVRLVILDINLPGMDGFAVCSKLRKSKNIPIIILSARVDREDKLNGFLQGADDYMEKPVDPEILVAKVGALFTRTYDDEGKKGQLRSGDILIDTEARKVYQNGTLLELNVKEYELLYLLVQNRRKALRKEYLFDRIWGAESDSEYQTLTVHIKRLRNKIEADPKHPVRIKTIWGVGYTYEEI